METFRLFDHLGRFVTRATLSDLERTVAKHGLHAGLVLAEGADFWQPVDVSLAQARQANVPRSGCYAKGERSSARKVG